jgi:elongation factor G
MAKYHVADIRNIALVGHGAAGKTSLADALLYAAKAVDRHGSVDDGTSVSDYDDEEKKRHFSIDTSILHYESNGKHVHLLDTPGYPDFVGSALEALSAVETAAVVISAPNGIEVNTRRMFNEAGRRGLARFLVINKMDADNIRWDVLVAAIRDTFGKACVFFNAPLGQGANFKGVVSVLTPPASPPAGCLVDLADARSKLIDAVVEADEELMMKYLDSGSVSDDELTAAIPKALAAGTVVPIVCTAAKKDGGIAELLATLTDFALSPVQGKKRVATKGSGDKAQEVTLEPDENGEFVGQVFKTLSDKFVGNLSFFRVYSGKITSEQPVVNVRTGKSSRTGGLLLMQGKTQKTVPDAIAGDIVAVAKIEDLHLGDTVAAKPDAPKLPPLVFPAPMYGLAVEPKARGDEQKISGSLQKIADEDPTFKITRDSQTKEMVINGMSQLHLDVVQSRLKKRFDLEVVTKEPKIPYRETVTAEGAADYRHKKQTGGAGQFGEVHLRVYPLPGDIHTDEECRERFMNKQRFPQLREDHSSYEPEYNFAFLDCIVGGTIPNQFLPAVRKGCLEVLETGAVAGYRMQNVAVEVYFGKSHPVDSKEVAFKTAGRMAFKKGIQGSRPAILEPIVEMEVTVPAKYTGTILGDLNTKRGRIENQDSLPGDLAVIKARAPLAEVMRYKASLDSITQGQGSYTMEFSHYEQVPGNVQQQIISKAKIAEEEED